MPCFTELTKHFLTLAQVKNFLDSIDLTFLLGQTLNQPIVIILQPSCHVLQQVNRVKNQSLVYIFHGLKRIFLVFEVTLQTFLFNVRLVIAVMVTFNLWKDFFADFLKQMSTFKSFVALARHELRMILVVVVILIGS